MSKNSKPFVTGEKIILLQANGNRQVRVVRNANASLVDVARPGAIAYWHFHQDGSPARGSGNDRIFHATPEQIAAVRKEQEALQQLKIAEQQQRIESDPRTPLIRRFKAGDFEPWEKLSLEQLQQISNWLEGK